MKEGPAYTNSPGHYRTVCPMCSSGQTANTQALCLRADAGVGRAIS